MKNQYEKRAIKGFFILTLENGHKIILARNKSYKILIIRNPTNIKNVLSLRYL